MVKIAGGHGAGPAPTVTYSWRSPETVGHSRRTVAKPWLPLIHGIFRAFSPRPLISGGVEEVGAFLGREAIKEVADALDKGIDGAGRYLPQQRLELGEGHLDRVHIRAVRGQVEELSAPGGDRLGDAGDLARHSSRRAATSGRSCSAACRIF